LGGFRASEAHFVVPVETLETARDQRRLAHYWRAATRNRWRARAAREGCGLEIDHEAPHML
jgi:hypothetical protein